MAYIDLGIDVGEGDPSAAFHGFGAAALGDAFTRDAPFDQAVRDARERLGIPGDTVILGLDDVGRYLGGMALPNTDS